MILISIVVLICWIIISILDAVNCTNNRKCIWLDYWLLYGVLIINLIDNIVEKRA